MFNATLGLVEYKNVVVGKPVRRALINAKLKEEASRFV